MGAHGEVIETDNGKRADAAFSYEVRAASPREYRDSVIRVWRDNLAIGERAAHAYRWIYEQAPRPPDLAETRSPEEAMTASDSSTHLAWLIHPNAPTARIDSMAGTESPKKPQQTRSDFAELQIEPGMLDRSH